MSDDSKLGDMVNGLKAAYEQSVYTNPVLEMSPTFDTGSWNPSNKLEKGAKDTPDPLPKQVTPLPTPNPNGKKGVESGR